MASTQVVGEPYALAGSRMAFASWRYVRPGMYGWFDDAGRNVTVHGDLQPGAAKLRVWDSPRGIRLVTEPAKRAGPILHAELPWERDGYPILTTVMQDGGVYRGWGTIGGWGDLKGRGETHFCYYESEDGKNWRRPGGDNRILAGEGGTVFIDLSAPTEQRYKFVKDATFSSEEVERYKQKRNCGIDSKAYRRDVGSTFGLRGATSPDGLKWTILPEPLALMHADTQPAAYFDPAIRKYVCYVRDWAIERTAPTHRDSDPMRWIAPGRRSIGRTESGDFREFPLSEIVLQPPTWLPASQVLYTNCRTSFPGAPDQHLMFPAVWDQSTDRTDLRLAVSGDGKLWDWLGVNEPPIFDTAHAGEWDGGCIFASPNLIELPDGAFALPYTGYDVPHKYPRKQAKRATGYAIWEKGRVAGIDAQSEGEFTTIAVVPPGSTVSINAKTQAGGSILVEAADLNGKALPGRSFADAVALSGDCHRTWIAWKEHDDLGGTDPVILRIRLRAATVYYIEFA